MDTQEGSTSLFLSKYFFEITSIKMGKYPTVTVKKSLRSFKDVTTDVRGQLVWKRKNSPVKDSFLGYLHEAGTGANFYCVLERAVALLAKGMPGRKQRRIQLAYEALDVKRRNWRGRQTKQQEKEFSDYTKCRLRD